MELVPDKFTALNTGVETDKQRIKSFRGEWIRRPTGRIEKNDCYEVGSVQQSGSLTWSQVIEPTDLTIGTLWYVITSGWLRSA